MLCQYVPQADACVQAAQPRARMGGEKSITVDWMRVEECGPMALVGDVAAGMEWFGYGGDGREEGLVDR